MREYTVKRVEGKPDWAAIEALKIDTVYREVREGVSAEAKICYDNDNIYVRLSTTEPRTVAKGRDILAEPCLDSCLEFFFSPIEGDGRYCNIEFNPNGVYYFGVGTSLKSRIRLLPANIHIFNARIARRNDGWSVTYRIPVGLIKELFPKFSLYSGKEMRAICYKCVEGGDEPHYLAWNPVPGRVLSFHRPDKFGRFIFE